MKRNARIKQRQEFIVALAMLRGAEIEKRTYYGGKLTHSWIVSDADGLGQQDAYTREYACELWLKGKGIHVGPNCEVADLSTTIEGNLER